MRAARLGTATPREVLAVFLRLGLTSFGGPIAHLGYFRRELVERRKWVDEAQFAELLALCQFLPGPASSQLGFTLGLVRAGWAGALAAFVGFTLPSALLLYAFAMFVPAMSPELAAPLVHGLKLVAVAVVGQGIVAMARTLCPDAARGSIAVAAGTAVLAAATSWMQLVAIAGGAVAGLALRGSEMPRESASLCLPHRRLAALALLALFAALLVVLPLVAHALGGLATVAAAFYRSGALVFGGGHVVLPLLQRAVVQPGWISANDFLAGYGAAQAVPGPMFSLAAFLGARLGGAAGSVTALLAIFLPGFLLVAGVLPLWRAIARHPRAARAVAGINAAVVGLLGAAFWNPVLASAVHGPLDAAIALAALAALVGWRAPPLAVVAGCVAAAYALALHA